MKKISLDVPRLLDRMISYVDSAFINVDGVDNSDLEADKKRLEIFKKYFKGLRTMLVSAEEALTGDAAVIEASSVKIALENDVVGDEWRSGNMLEDLAFILTDINEEKISHDIESLDRGKGGNLSYIYFYDSEGKIPVKSETTIEDSTIVFYVAAEFDNYDSLYKVSMQGDLGKAVNDNSGDNIKIDVYFDSILNWKQYEEQEDNEGVTAEDMAELVVTQRSDVISIALANADKKARAAGLIPGAKGDRGEELSNSVVDFFVDDTAGYSNNDEFNANPRFIGDILVFYMIAKFAKYTSYFQVKVTGLIPGDINSVMEENLQVDAEFKDLIVSHIKEQKIKNMVDNKFKEMEKTEVPSE